jgi:hypothetical protein
MLEVRLLPALLIYGNFPFINRPTVDTISAISTELKAPRKTSPHAGSGRTVV